MQKQKFDCLSASVASVPSGGAMTCRFPTKEGVIIEVVEHLLDPMRGQTRRNSASCSGGTGRGKDLREDLNRLWSRVVNTTKGRAFLRGVHVQERFEDDPAMTARVMDRFAEIMADHPGPRDSQD